MDVLPVRNFFGNSLVNLCFWWCFDLLDEHKHKEVKILTFLLDVGDVHVWVLVVALELHFSLV